jgi:hypothetical protein
LAGPDLEHARANNVVTGNSYAAFYDMKYIFKRFVKFFWDLRAAYKKADDLAGSTLCKYLLNSLYGKFAQGVYEWIPFTVSNTRSVVESLGEHFPECYDDERMLPKIEKGQIKWAPKGLSSTIKLRRISTLNQIQQKVGYHSDSFIAIASYVTSYARRYLMDLLEIAGRKNVFYYDTDSIFCNRSGYTKLVNAKRVDPNDLGRLKIEGVESTATFLAPKDYLFGDDISLKGIRKNAIPICEHSKPYYKCSKCKHWSKDQILRNGRFKQNQFEGLAGISRRGYDPYIEIKPIEKKISHRYRKGRVGLDGWTVPFNLPDDLGLIP